MKTRRFITPIRNQTLAQETKVAFDFANKIGTGDEDEFLAITEGYEHLGIIFQLAGMAILKSLLELALTMYSKTHIEHRQESAQRFLMICKWMIQRYGTDGAEVITRVCMIGSMLEELEPGGRFYIELKDGEKIVVSMEESFTYAIKNARAIKAGTCNSSLG